MKMRKQILIFLLLALLFSAGNGFLPNHSHIDHYCHHQQEINQDNDTCNHNDFCLTCIVRSKNIATKGYSENYIESSLYTPVLKNKSSRQIDKKPVYYIKCREKTDFTTTIFKSVCIKRAPPLATI